MKLQECQCLNLAPEKLILWELKKVAGKAMSALANFQKAKKVRVYTAITSPSSS